VDGSGVALASNKVGLAITIDRIVVDELSDKGVALMQRLANLLQLEYADIYQNTRLCGELPTGQKAGCWQGSRYQPIPITKSADPNTAIQIVERADLFPGVTAKPVAIRSYPSFFDVNAAHLLGYVGPLTENDLLSTNEKQYFRSESIGKSGLEIQYDSYLRGVPGIRTVIVDRKESITRESQNTASIDGDHLVTSLDVRLQAATEKALKDAVLRGRANGYTSDSGAAVVMDVKTGPGKKV
jgi:penicillin-binding protein 2